MTVDVFGIRFTSGCAEAVLAAAAAHPASQPRLIVTTNMDHVVTLSESAAFRAAYDGAVARTLDGMPVVWLARLRGAPDAMRVTGHDLLAAALREPATAATRIFLICATTEVGAVMTGRLYASGLAPGTVAVAVPPWGFERDEFYGRQLAARVREHGTTLLILGIGAPKSEIWVDRQGAALGGPVVLPVGEALNVAAGLVPRAPVAMQRLGLEWLFRFVHAPRRLFRRYFVRSWRFLWIVWRTRTDHRQGPFAGASGGS